MVGRWLLQSHFSSYLLREPHTAEGGQLGVGRGRGREAYREKRGLRIRGAERGASHPKSKRAPSITKG